jgi:hypothetical protein
VTLVNAEPVLRLGFKVYPPAVPYRPVIQAYRLAAMKQVPMRPLGIESDGSQNKKMDGRHCGAIHNVELQSSLCLEPKRLHER